MVTAIDIYSALIADYGKDFFVGYIICPKLM